jgi:Hemoglobin-like flavoprotein
VEKYLSSEDAKIVKMTGRAFKAFGTEIAEATYARLALDPEGHSLFTQFRPDLPGRAERFGGEMFAVAENIDRLNLISDLLDRIAHRHLAEGWTPDQYPVVLKAMLPAIRDVLGEGASDRVLDAWREGYWRFVGQLLEKQDAIRRKFGVARAA